MGEIPGYFAKLPKEEVPLKINKRIIRYEDARFADNIPVFDTMRMQPAEIS
jgi:hypothetical protein